MPNIFGKEQHEYRQLTELADRKLLDPHNTALRIRGRVHNFDALPQQPVAIPLNDIQTAAQSLSFMTNNFQAIQAEIEEILHVEFRLDEWIPIKTSGIPEGAQSYATRIIERYGRGKFIDNSGSTVPTATVSMTTVSHALRYAGILAEWTENDVRNAAFGGVALDTETITAATNGAMDHIEEVGLIGDEAAGFEGLLNHSGIAITPASKAISAMSAAEMVAFIQAGFISIIEATKEIFPRQIKGGATIYLPISQADLILNTPFGTTGEASKSVWQYVETSNMYTHMTNEKIKLAIVQELTNAAANGTDDRAIFGWNNNRVMEIAMPIQPRAMGVFPEPYKYISPFEWYIGGVDLKRPAAMAYYDGI